MSKRKSGPTISLQELAARFQATAVPSTSLATNPIEDKPVAPIPATPPEPPAAKKPKQLSSWQQRQRRLLSEHGQAAEGLIRTLRERHPGCFGDPPRPLALRIDFAIATEFPDVSAEVHRNGNDALDPAYLLSAGRCPRWAAHGLGWTGRRRRDR